MDNYVLLVFESEDKNYWDKVDFFSFSIFQVFIISILRYLTLSRPNFSPVTLPCLIVLISKFEHFVQQ